jgi:hypothetical protein
MKECRTCKKVKDESEFSVNRIDQKTGNIFYKPDCKACKRKTTIKDHNTTIKKTITNHKVMDKDNNISDNFNLNEPIKSANKDNTITDHNIYTRLNTLEREVTNIKSQIKSNTIDHNNTITDHNIMVNYEFDKKNRIKATYNIEKDIKNTLDKHCESNLKNHSDIVNIALLEFFNRQK